MKRICILITLLVSLSAVACARNVILNWDDPQTNVTWNAYLASGDCSVAEGEFNQINPSPITERTYTDNNVPFGLLAYRVTTVGDDNGTLVESEFSGCAFVQVTPSSPQNLTLTLDPP